MRILTNRKIAIFIVFILCLVLFGCGSTYIGTLHGKVTVSGFFNGESCDVEITDDKIKIYVLRSLTHVTLVM